MSANALEYVEETTVLAPENRGSEIVEYGQDVFIQQADELKKIAYRLDNAFATAVNMCIECQGRVIISGMGKSGIVGKKIAATLSSTGTPCHYVHPGEAYHGDLGMITPGDVVILLSYSGETEEVLKLLPYLKYIKAKIISITGGARSTLARNSDVVLDVWVERESCPNNLAPTTSTTVTMAMGDALAVALMRLRNFKPNDFARFHPGGSLGKKLLSKVSDVMHTSIPTTKNTDLFNEVVSRITTGCLGIAVVEDEHGKMLGVITDGDLRRAIEKFDDLRSLTASQIMSANPLTIDDGAMFADAEALMVRHKVSALVACNSKGKAVGVVKFFDAI